MKTLLSVFAILALVSSALAVKESNYFASGSVYCDSHCTIQVAYKVDPTWNVLYACGVGNQSYIFDANGNCVPTSLGTHFRPTTDQ